MTRQIQQIGNTLMIDTERGVTFLEITTEEELADFARAFIIHWFEYDENGAGQLCTGDSRDPDDFRRFNESQDEREVESE